MMHTEIHAGKRGVNNVAILQSSRERQKELLLEMKVASALAATRKSKESFENRFAILSAIGGKKGFAIGLIIDSGLSRCGRVYISTFQTWLVAID